MSEKTKNERTEACEAKYTALVGSSNDSEISLVALESIPLNMAMEEITTSFATSPARSADTTAQLSKPSGAKIGERNLPIV